MDDEPLVRQLVSDVLSLHGYRVLQAEHGEDALRILEEETISSIALVVTDITMPTMGGIELSERIRDMAPGLKIVFMSGYLDDSAVLASLAAKQEPLLQKPFTPQQLIQRVNDLLGM